MFDQAVTQTSSQTITVPSGLQLPLAGKSYSVWSSLRTLDRMSLHCPMLSLKTVLNGEEIYHFRDRTVRLCAGEFLLVRADTDYDVQIQTRFETLGRCFYFAAQDAQVLNDLVDQLGTRLHHVKFEWNELNNCHPFGLSRKGTRAVADALSQWSAAWLDQLARVDRVDPLTKARVLNGLQRAHRLIHERYGEPWTVSQLAEAAHLSRASFTRSFTRLYGVSPKRLLEQVRLQVAAAKIAARTDSITTISVNCGYADLPTFSRAFRRYYGIAPSSWAKVPRPVA
ncbi:MAG: AraC family transcriptional regulator [Pseudomonadota bacterium]